MGRQVEEVGGRGQRRWAGRGGAGGQVAAVKAAATAMQRADGRALEEMGWAGGSGGGDDAGGRRRCALAPESEIVNSTTLVIILLLKIVAVFGWSLSPLCFTIAFHASPFVTARRLELCGAATHGQATATEQPLLPLRIPCCFIKAKINLVLKYYLAL